MFSLLDKSLLTETSYTKIVTINACYRALEEGVDDHFVVSTARKYTHSLLVEVLETVKDNLLKFAQHILSALNNFILNNAKLVDKYRNLIIERYDKLKVPFMYKTYQYPKLKAKDYPVVIKTSTDLEKDIISLQDKIIKNNLSASDTEAEVYKMVSSFGEQVVGAAVDIYDLKGSVREAVTSKLRGREMIKKLSSSDLNGLIDELIQYKPMKDDIVRTRTNLISEYEVLKRTYTKMMEDKEADSTGIKSIKDPDFQKFQAHEYQRFMDINLHMTKLFNAYITIYSEAYNTKLSILQDKINENRTIINNLLTATGVFAAVNAKNPPKQKRPYKMDLEIK